MRRLLFAGSLIAAVVAGLFALSRVPLNQLETLAAVNLSQVHGGRRDSLRVRPRKPYDTNVDQVIDLLPFCPCVKEIRMVPMDGLRDRLARVAKSPWIVSIDLVVTNLEDDDLASLNGMRALEWLDLLGNERITDKGIAHLAKCTKLRMLNLEGTGVTGAGLARLAECKELERLRLADCPITDETVVLIPRFPKVKNMSLAETQITENGLMHFVEWHRLDGLGVPKAISREARIEFNRQWLEAYDRARAAGEDLPEKARPPVYVRE